MVSSLRFHTLSALPSPPALAPATTCASVSMSLHVDPKPSLYPFLPVMTHKKESVECRNFSGNLGKRFQGMVTWTFHSFSLSPDLPPFPAFPLLFTIPLPRERAIVLVTRQYLNHVYCKHFRIINSFNGKSEHSSLCFLLSHVWENCLTYSMLYKNIPRILTNESYSVSL